MTSSSSLPPPAAISLKAAAVPGTQDYHNHSDDDEDSVASPNTDDFTVKPIPRIRGDTASSKPSVAQTENGSDNEDEGSRIVQSNRALEFGNGAEQSALPVTEGTGAVQRIWSLDEDVVFLKGMVEYKETSGTDPCQHILKFYEFIKSRLQIQVSKEQLLSKIRKMKSKFLSKDDAWVLSRPLEKPAFEVSKKIWGEEKLKLNPTAGKKSEGKQGGTANNQKDDKMKGVKFNGSSSGKSKLNRSVVLALPVPEEIERKQGGTAKKQKVDHKSKEVKLKIVRRTDAVSKPSLCWMDAVIEFSMKLGNGELDCGFIRDGMKLVANSELQVLNEKWGKIEVEAAELHLKRLDLIHASTQMILDALHSFTR